MSNKCASGRLLTYRNGTWIVDTKPQTAAPSKTANRRFHQKNTETVKKEQNQTKTKARTAWTWASLGLTWPVVNAIGLGSLIGVSLACNVVQYMVILTLLNR